VMSTCPFRYFLKHELGVRDIEEPPDDLRISPLVKGSLVHRILERFYLDAAANHTVPSAGEAWNPDAHARMKLIALEECAIDEAHGLTGTAMLWQLDRRRILDSLDAFLIEDDVRRAQGFVFESAEAAFGADGETSFALPDGRRIRFRGRIDRADRAADGRIAVYDYKTGKSDKYGSINNKDNKADPLAHGQHLQLPVYALALGAGDGHSQVAAYYWFLDDADAPLRGYVVDSGQLERFGEAVADLDATIGAGLFPANPGGTAREADNCRNCAFERACAPRLTRLPRLMQRVAATPELRRYATLAGLDALDEDDTQDEDEASYG